MKILFLINTAFGIGGTITTTFNLAGTLAARGHEVEVLSTTRGRDLPMLPVDPAVRLTALVETRPAHPDFTAEHPLKGKPPRHYPKADFRSYDYDLMTEDRFERYLRTSDADVVIATRAGLIAYTARFAPRRMITIGQEHLTRGQQRKAMREELPRHLRRLDAFVTVTERDAEDYRKHARLGRTRLLSIPNSVPAPIVPPSDGSAKVVVAAGRLVESKRYDLLVRAFAQVVTRHPDWRLRVYGWGRTEPDLRALIAELGLHNHVLLMGPYTPIETEWAKGAIAAVPSDREPFGMTLVEAMRAGVPVVSTDAPHGPREILADGHDGLLTPVGEADALAAALNRLIEDPAEREAMAAAALKNGARYDPAPIGERYEQLFDELRAARRSPGPIARLLARRTAAVAPPAVLGPAPTLQEPTAHCRITLTGQAASPARPGDPADQLDLTPGHGMPPDARLVWRRIGGNSEELPVDADLAEGAWSLQIEGGGIVQAGPVDTRALIDGPFRPVARLPYRLSDGGLALRVWRRPVVAEVGDVDRHPDSVRITGRLHGATLDRPVLEMRSPGRDVREIPVTVLPGDRWQAVVPPVDAATWQIWLRYADGKPAVKTGRILDDVAGKQTAYHLPRAGAAEVFYESDNTLAVRVKP